MKKGYAILILILFQSVSVLSQDIRGTWEITKVKHYYSNLRGEVKVTTYFNYKGIFVFEENHCGQMDCDRYVSCGDNEFTWSFQDEPPTSGKKRNITVISHDRNKMELSSAICGYQTMDHSEWLQIELKKVRNTSP